MYIFHHIHIIINYFLYFTFYVDHRYNRYIKSFVNEKNHIIDDFFAYCIQLSCVSYCHFMLMNMIFAMSQLLLFFQSIFIVINWMIMEGGPLIVDDSYIKEVIDWVDFICVQFYEIHFWSSLYPIWNIWGVKSEIDRNNSKCDPQNYNTKA